MARPTDENYNAIEILEALDKEFGQPGIYMWSTYILPNGHFLNPDNGNSEEAPAYEHEDFDDWVYENFGMAGHNVLEGYCIKMNVTYPYLHLPEVRITPEQIKAIRKIIDNRGEFEYANEDIAFSASNMSALDMEEPLMVLYNRSVAVFDLAVYNASDIIKNISQVYYVGKFIFESADNNERLNLYRDQDDIELYDLYDYGIKEPTPEMLKNAEVIKESGDGWRKKVYIDYPYDGYFSLNGRLGRTDGYIEAGKKAYVRDNYYEHPEKDWKSKIVTIEPYEYIEMCFDMFNKYRDAGLTSIEKFIEARASEYDLEQVFGQGDIFLPTIDYRYNQQEGLHRAIFAMMIDIPEIDVIIIEKK